VRGVARYRRVRTVLDAGVDALAVDRRAMFGSVGDDPVTEA
jgi:hypothetical protein